MINYHFQEEERNIDMQRRSWITHFQIKKKLDFGTLLCALCVFYSSLFTFGLLILVAYPRLLISGFLQILCVCVCVFVFFFSLLLYPVYKQKTELECSSVSSVRSIGVKKLREEISIHLSIYRKVSKQK